jgi:hypothetical protein
MKLWIHRTGGIVGGVQCVHELASLSDVQRRLLEGLFERAAAAPPPAPDNRPRYRLREERDDGTVREVEVEEQDMPDGLLALTRLG